jgi:pimeloyl-ACP methyl ester carboxylesterase
VVLRSYAVELKAIDFEAAGMRLHGLEGPASGPALLLLHGATSNSRAWMSVIPQLAQRWHIYAFDLRGHGLSGRPADLEGYNLRYHVADTVALLRKVVREPAVLMGHSYGAVIAALTGMPGAAWLRGIVLEDPPLMLRRDNTDSQDLGFIGFFKWLYALRQSAQTVEELMPALSPQNPAASEEEQRAMAQSLAWLDPNYLVAITCGNERETAREVDFEAHIRGIACPVLLMQADLTKGAALLPQDLEFFMAHARNARLVTFPGSGHGIHVDQPFEFLRAFDEFTAGLA